MNGLNRNQVLASLAAVFVAGAAAGVAVGYPLGRKTVIQRPPRPPHDMAAHMLEKYTRELALSTNQVATVEPLIQEATQRVRALHKENFRQTDAIMKECNRRIFALLDPGQQQRFKDMEERRNKWFRERQAERDRNRPPQPGKPGQGDEPAPPPPATPPAR
jgi:hypothetical protein